MDSRSETRSSKVGIQSKSEPAFNQLSGAGQLSILHVSHNNFVEGGSDRYFLELSDLLRQNGNQVIPFCAADERNLESPWSKYFPKTVLNRKYPEPGELVRCIYSVSARKQIRRLLTDEDFDIAHLHIYYGKQTASILKPLREHGIPIVQSLHEYKLLCPVYTMVSQDKICEACEGKYFYRALPKRCNRDSYARTLLSVIQNYVAAWLGAVDDIDHFIGVSHFMSNKMIEHGVPSEKVSTVHNFIDSTRYEAARGTGKGVLYFGRLEKLKGIYTLLEAMMALPGVECVIAGDGNERGLIERFIAEKGIENVRLVGFVGGNALHDLIRDSICTVIPSEWYENCPMSVLESMALGRPVIGAEIGGIPELIDHGCDGLLFKPGDIAGLTEAISSLAGDTERAAAMGLEGRRKMERQFNKDLHYERIRNVYAKVCG